MQFINRWAHRLSTAGELFGVLGILIMTSVTCLDVAGAKLFNLPVPGSTEVISLAQVVTIVFAIATTYLHKGHISVEMFMTNRHPVVKSLIRIFVVSLGLMLFSVLLYQGVLLGNEYLSSGEVTATIQLPFYPFAYAFAIAMIPIVLLLLAELIKEIKGVLN